MQTCRQLKKPVKASSRRIHLEADTDRHTRLFNITVINICKNYIPNKYLTFNGKDPSWLNDHKRLLIRKKNALFQEYLKDGRTVASYTNLQKSKAELTVAIRFSKSKYFKRLGDKLSNPTTSSKIYWSIIKTFVDGKNSPIILTLLVNDKLSQTSWKKLISLMISLAGNADLC